MSGGFFRGTSADQDTRFSNKQAKLLKSQKFAPELDHLVDISKVKMDVVKPWIAHKVTELLGFEDEVLINFIYGLLEGKDINGKQVQIQITGFMEKNTGKFMKELWSLLLSAQSNASGVPQQFLDAKEEEIRKKKAESDRITLEIQKKKELEQEKLKKMDGEVDVSSDVGDVSNRSAKHLLQRDSTAQLEEEQKQFDERNDLRGRSRISRSPHSMKRSPSAERIRRSRSISKSLSNSRSYSGGRLKSRSISRSPQSRGRSISPKRRYPSPHKRSTSPRSKHSPRRARSPMRRRSPHLRRRSSSDSWERSPSPRQRRSPIPVRRRLSPRRRRSPSPVRRRSPSLRRRRSPSPLRRRSPPSRRRRSPSPVRRRSPSVVRRRSPSPMRRRSPFPMRRRSPLHRRSPSPVRRRSPAPPRRRSPSPPWRSPSPPLRRSPSPVRRRSPPRSPKQRRSPFRSPRPRHRSGSPYRSHSPVYRSRRSWSRDHDIVGNGGGSKGYRDTNACQRTYRDRSPVRQARERDRSGQGRRGPDSIARQPPITLRSPQRDPRDRTQARREVPLSLPLEERSPSRSESSPFTGKSSPNDDRRIPSLSGSPIRRTLDRAAYADSASPLRQPRDKVTPQESPETDRDEGTRHARGDGGQRNDSPRRIVRRSPRAGSHRNLPIKEPHDEVYFPEVGGRRSSESQRREDKRETSRNDWHKKSHRPGTPQQSPQIAEELEFEHGRIEGARFSPDYVSDEQPSGKQRRSPSSRGPHKSHSKEHYEIDERKRSHSQNALDSGLNQNTESAHKTMKKGESNNKTAYHDSDSVENDKNKSGDVEIRKNKRSERREIASDDSDSYDSHTDERKLAKRRKKEEKRLRKEEKRRRRHEKHRRREERRASKHKAKSMDTVTPPSDFDKNHSVADYSDGQVASKRDSHPSDTEEPESEQKRLEIELREKALESLRAKKAINP